ncbi:hypothetical protein GCM10009839_41130 [Catenulispora yoronensis]|uniref:Thaumatin family protein n=1 Tax=Catenulispora yoronensis TaxID=450799 RepID=A0ABN2UGR1_9ACTN
MLATVAVVAWFAGFGTGDSKAGQVTGAAGTVGTATSAAQAATSAGTSGAGNVVGTAPSPSSGSLSSPSSPASSRSGTAGGTSSGSRASGSSGSSSSKPAPATGSSSIAAAPGSHLITIVNADHQTIWAATNPNAEHPIPVTGWQLAPGQSVTFAVPKGWGGRVWGRTGCLFNAAGSGHCQTGDCGGVFQCRGTGGTPATLAELTFDSFDGLDFYDVSLVDGSNLPMYINTTHRVGPDPVTSNGCYQGACTKPIVCPAAMQVKVGGQQVACTTACAAFGTDDYCCRGKWSGRENCIPAKWPVDYAKQVFKDAEPYAYSYAFDDSATMACKGGCDYRIVFGVT